MAELFDDNFKSTTMIKNKLVNSFTYDEDLAKCLLSTRKDFKKYELSEDEIESIPYNYVYPFLFTIGTTQETKSFITMGFRYLPSKGSHVFKIGNMSIYCFCHKDIVRTNYGLRYDYMLQCVNRLVFQSKDPYWIGKIEFVGMEDVVSESNRDYVGIVAKYRSTELM